MKESWIGRRGRTYPRVDKSAHTSRSTPTLFEGIDYHKRYSVVPVLNTTDATVKKSRVEPTSLGGFVGFPCGIVRAVFESLMNWGYLYDLLHEIEADHDVTLAHPYKSRIIVEAQIKTNSAFFAAQGRPRRWSRGAVVTRTLRNEENAT